MSLVSYESKARLMSSNENGDFDEVILGIIWGEDELVVVDEDNIV